MAGINRVILIGNLGKDPDVITFENGVKKASFSLATSESYKNKEGNRVDQTEWHNPEKRQPDIPGRKNKNQVVRAGWN